jgi:hypothetical protein
MDQTQTRIIELLREVHLLAIKKEVERLNMRIVELENQHRQAAEKPIPKPAAQKLPPVHPAPITPPFLPDAPDLLNEHQRRKVRPVERCQRAPLAAVSHGSEVFEDRRCRSISAGGCRILAQFLQRRAGLRSTLTRPSAIS